MPSQDSSAENYGVNCPVCGSGARPLRALPADFIRRALAEIYNEPDAVNVAIADYDLYRCPACTLEFANPMLPGDDAFYSWVVKHHQYYPNERWGWAEIRNTVREIAGKNAERPTTVVDVGCGAGAFLSFLNRGVEVRRIGIDTTQSSVESCRVAGHEAFRCDVAAAREHLPEGADVVTSFHCLEHVGNPVEFVQAAKALLKPGGRLFISTPYSPMSFEHNWFDPLNHPPHHLTRWNEASYRALANRLEMKATIWYGPTRPLIYRVLFSLMLQARETPFLGRSRARRALGLAIFLLTHPGRFIAELSSQLTRDKTDGRVAPDEILVEFHSAAA